MMITMMMAITGSTSPLEHTIEKDKATGKTALDDFREQQLQRSSEKQEVPDDGGASSDMTAR